MRFMLVSGFLLLISTLKGDDRFGTIGQYSVEANYQFGRIIPHNSRFHSPVTEFTHSVELSFYKQTLGDKAWQRKLHYPELGGSFVFVYNGDQQVFGNVYIGLAVAKFWIVRGRNVDFYVRAGTGLAVTPTHYNIVHNTVNNAIGSLFNSADQLRFGLDFKTDVHIHVCWGVTLTHYSNAGAQPPNLGVNVAAFTMGIRYFPYVSDNLRYNRSKVPRPTKKNEVMFKLGIALHEMRPIGGPKYPVYVATLNYARYTSITNKMLLGMSTEFNQDAFDLYFYSKEKVKYGRIGSSFNTSLFAGDEIMMGKMSMFFMAGGYIFNPRHNTPVYVKLGLNYYYLSIGKNKTTRLFVGMSLKSHFFVAQFGELSTGIAF